MKRLFVFVFYIKKFYFQYKKQKQKVSSYTYIERTKYYKLLQITIVF